MTENELILKLGDAQSGSKNHKATPKITVAMPSIRKSLAVVSELYWECRKRDSPLPA